MPYPRTAPIARRPYDSVTGRCARHLRTRRIRLPSWLPVVFLAITTSCQSTPSRRAFDLPGRTDARPYHHLVVNGDTAYVAGTIGIDPATGRAPADAREEVRLALDGVRRKLALVGLTMDDLISVQVFCSDLTLYDTFNEVYASFFERNFPVRAFIGSGPILFDGRFEICAVAALR
ncbi:MAG: RidA family protein [Planctomycetota bacterium]